MEKRVFILQNTLSHWLEQRFVCMDDEDMTISVRGQRFQLQEALLIRGVEGDAVDRTGLVGRVMTHEELAGLGAERFRNSVILDDVAYSAEEGYLSVPIADLRLEDFCFPEGPARAFPAPSAPGRGRARALDVTAPYFPVLPAAPQKKIRLATDGLCAEPAADQ